LRKVAGGGVLIWKERKEVHRFFYEDAVEDLSSGEAQNETKLTKRGKEKRSEVLIGRLSLEVQPAQTRKFRGTGMEKKKA